MKNLKEYAINNNIETDFYVISYFLFSILIIHHYLSSIQIQSLLFRIFLTNYILIFFLGHIHLLSLIPLIAKIEKREKNGN